MASAVDLEIADEVALCYADPLRFVMLAWPWGEPGPLEHETGPDDWQREFLTWIGQQVKANRFDGTTPVSALRATTSSGHGIGKSVMVAWLVAWIMSTRPHCQGTVTANTFTQLQTKTWAAIQRWMKSCLTSHWFTLTSEKIYHNDHKE